MICHLDFGIWKLNNIVPRKTKQQKILSKLRRLEQKPASETSTEVRPEISLEGLSTSAVNLRPEATDQPTPKDDRYNYSYVYKDIRKIFILTAIALALEIILSLTASGSYAKLVLRTLNLEF